MSMTAADDTIHADARAALDAARVVFSPDRAATAAALWSAAQDLLQRLIARPELTGQALVGEVRRLGRLTLSDAHALVALAAWADRATGAASNEAEQLIVREAWIALDHAASPPMTAPATQAAPSPSVPAAAGAADRLRALPDDTSVPAPTSHRRRPLVRLGALTLLLAALGGGSWWWFAGRADRILERGVEAYQRGTREVARVAFAESARLDPNDARPLVYLGRMSREDGDLARARRLLTTAVRVAPGSAIANRELAALMLADGQPEIARRFYVRALEIDPADRSAQGFLGCALAKLNRTDEARRWFERAGPGDWQRCSPFSRVLASLSPHTE
jgi:tetratricopeptide (TPR) repeat protein